MAVKCIDNQTEFELININTSDQQVNDIANNFIQDRHINVQQSVGFNCMLLNIAGSLDIDITDTNSLIYYFNIYTQLCSICHILPDMTGYSMFIDVSYETMKDWLDGTTRNATHTHVVKKMRDFCKLTCVSEAGRGNVGAIYVSKAIHGLSDSPAPSSYTQNNVYINAPVSRDQIAAEFGAIVDAEKPPELPENSG